MASGYTRVTVSAYSATKGFGWQTTKSLSSADRGSSTGDALTRDIHLGSNHTFLVDLPMGTYSVTPTVGDTSYVRDYVSIWAEGQLALGNLSTNKNQFGSPSFVTIVTDGQLTLRIADGGGVTSKFAIAALDIVPVQSPVPTPTSTPTPMPTASPTPNPSATPTPTPAPTTTPTAIPTPTPPTGEPAPLRILDISTTEALQSAALNLQAGDLVIVRAGNYAGFNIANSGTAAHRIIFRGEAGAVINAPVNYGGGVYGINASGKSYITLEGLTFAPQEGQGEWYSAIRLGGTGVVDEWAYGNIIRNNVVRMREVNVSSTPDKYGIYSSWQDGIVVEKNTVSGTWNTGIYTTENSRNYIVRGNEVFNAGGNGLHNNAGPMGSGVIKNALLEGNIIHNVGLGVGGQAISCDGVQDSRIQNNLLYDIHAKGISLYVVNAKDGSKNNVVMNNTIVNIGIQPPMRINYDCPYNTIMNNIFIASSSTSAWIDAEESGLTGTVLDFNVTYGVPKVGGVTRSDWKSSYGFDGNTIASTPATLFVNFLANDYHLKAGSPAINNGTSNQAPTKDIEGLSRPSGSEIDIGAHEYQF